MKMSKKEMLFTIVSVMLVVFVVGLLGIRLGALPIVLLCFGANWVAKQIFGDKD